MSDLFMKRGAWLSDDLFYRWTLERCWDESQPMVCFCGTNPSKADAKVDDPTVLRWVHFGRLWGFGGFIAVNMFPYRSSSPAECRAWWESGASIRHVMRDNEEAIQGACRRSAMFVACWGNNVWWEPGPAHITRLVQRINGQPVYCFGTTKDGAPKHPLARGHHRVPNDQQPIVWRAAA